MLLELKTRRVAALYSLATTLEPTAGETVSGRGFQFRPNSRRIAIDDHTAILLHPKCRLKMGWGSPHRIRELCEMKEDSICMEVLRSNMPCVQANIFEDGTIEIHRFIPGLWQRSFGFEDEGDTVSLLPNVFYDPLDPIFQAWLERNPRPAH